MPLRNERQAYWDDIENHIARVQPLTASQALDRVPHAAAERLALKSRLRKTWRSRRGRCARARPRRRACSRARRMRRSISSRRSGRSRRRAGSSGAGFRTTARTVNASACARRNASRRATLGAPARIASGPPRRSPSRAPPLRGRTPRAQRALGRRRGLAAHGGGGTRWCCNAPPRSGRRRRAARPSASALYFMESGGVRRDPSETRVETSDSFCHANDTMNRTSAAALRGWEPAGKGRGGNAPVGGGGGDDDDDESVLPLPRDSKRRLARPGRLSNYRGTTGVRSVSHVSHGHASIGCRSATRVASGGSLNSYRSSRGKRVRRAVSASSGTDPPSRRRRRASRANGVGRLLR